MGQKDNKNVVMLAPMTFRALEAIITHDPPEYPPELKDPLQRLDPSAKQALEGKDKKWKESDGLFYDNRIYVPKNYKLHEQIIQDHHDNPYMPHLILTTSLNNHGKRSQQTWLDHSLNPMALMQSKCSQTCTAITYM